MPQQKLPLFGGIIAPVHNGVLANGASVDAIPAVVGGCPDNALSPRGVQNYHEIHLWLKPGNDPTEIYLLYAQDNSDPTYARAIWAGSLPVTFGGITYGPAVKVLDGYPLRGDVTLYLVVNTSGGGSVDQYPRGPQVYGYYYVRGKGPEVQDERRFIGEDSRDSDEVTVGFPYNLAAGEDQVIHTFENDRIDDISLSFRHVLPSLPDGLQAWVDLYFEDENGNSIIPNHQVRFNVLASRYYHDPQSVYDLFQIPLGGGISPAGLANPSRMRVEVDDASTVGVAVHGYFTRR